MPSHEALVEWLDGWRASAPDLTVYATDETGDVVLDGSHAADAARRSSCSAASAPGCRRALRDLADATVAIPMAGSASSLNVAVAHGIVLHHLLSARLTHPCLTTCPSPS